MARWLYHALPRASWSAALQCGALSPPSLTSEGFVHCSYRDLVVASARLYLGDSDPVVLRVDPRPLLARGVAIDEAETPRGPMPHVHGPLSCGPGGAVVDVLELDEVAGGPDAIDEG